MARDFGVTDPEYLKALEEIRKIELPQSYWDELAEFLNTPIDIHTKKIKLDND